MPNRVWKPLEVGGLRLYQVSAYKDCGILFAVYIVADKSGSEAARYVEDVCLKGVPYSFAIGQSLDVLMPADWWENGTPCIHEEDREGRT